MPIYKGTVEVTSGNLHKGSTEIENGYKATNSFYINQTTVSFLTPTGQGLTYSTPVPQSSSGSPGDTFPTTTFTVTTAGDQGITGGSLSITGLPSTLTATIGSISNGPNNNAVITISGTFPVNSSLNTQLTVSGISLVQYYTLTLNYSGLTVPNTQQGVLSVSASLSGGYNNTDNGSIFTTKIANGSSTSVSVGYANPTPAQSNQMYQQTVFDRGLSSGGSSLSISNGATFVIPTIPQNVVSFNVTSSTFVVNGNTSISVTGRAVNTLNNKTWGYSILATHSGSSGSQVNLSYNLINTAGNPWNNPGGSGSRNASMSANNSGIFLSGMVPPGGTFAPSKSAAVPYGTAPAISAFTTATGSNDYYFNYGGNTVTTTVTFT